MFPYDSLHTHILILFLQRNEYTIDKRPRVYIRPLLCVSYWVDKKVHCYT